MTSIHRRSGWIRYELILLAVALYLILEIFPTLKSGLLSVVDVRTWSRPWLTANLVILGALIAIRFGPDLYAELTRWRDDRKSGRRR